MNSNRTTRSWRLRRRPDGIINENDFSILNKQNTKEIFSLKLANNLRLSDNDNLQTQNQIGQKTSNFFSELMYLQRSEVHNIFKITDNRRDYNQFHFLADLSNSVISFNFVENMCKS